MLNSVFRKGAVALYLVSSLAVHGLEITQEKWEQLQKRVDDQQAQVAAQQVQASPVDTALDSKYGPNAPVTTKAGKLQIIGLTQIWYYNEGKDKRGFFDDPNVNGIADSNAGLNTNGFRIRRTDIKMIMDLNENIRTVLMIDPAREALGFPALPSNQGNIFGTKAGNYTAPGFKSNGINSTVFITAAQNGLVTSGAPRLLQDAYINWHDCIPHHDIQVGQFIPWNGEEGPRFNGSLDFAERSMTGFICNTRDMGASIHGSWWECENNQGDGRFQYWAGVFDGAGTYFEPGNNQNRPDTNDSKDMNVRGLVRPLWDDCWGKLEIGVSGMAGKHGQGHNDLPITAPSNGLNRPSDWASRYNAWASYKCGDMLSGLWMRTEWTWIKDREAPGSVIDVGGNGTGTNLFAQQLGQPFSKQGIYGTLAYNFADSKICNVPCWLKPVEILGRFDQFQNIETADLVIPYKTDVFYTRAWTAGVNYYIKGHNAKVQANYNIVDLPADKSSPNRVFHDVRNDNFVINFQVMF